MPRNENVNSRTVLVDMDGVMADFETPNNAIISKYFPDLSLVADRPDFYFSDTYREYPDVVAKIDEEVRRTGFFQTFPLVDGVIQGWQRILAAGYTPRVCSSPLENHATVIQEKRAWLEEYFVPIFGRWVVETAIFDRDKSGYDAFAMIDDRPTLRNIERAPWQHIVFTQSYNTSVATAFRLDSWHDPDLEDMLARARADYVTTL